MARHGTIPRRLASCAVPVCTACLYGKATRRKWRHKSSGNEAESYTPTSPGEVVSVDQMVSPTPGLVAQMSGTLTIERYKCATIFIDHATDLSFVFLQKTASAEETVEAKAAFERYAQEQGVSIMHYHGDNGVFWSHLWSANCLQKGQGLTFAGVNAHHQNGKAERRIRELQQTARTMLIHAQRRWPSAITTNLWPYAIRIANDMLNATPSLKLKDGKHRHPCSADHRCQSILFIGSILDARCMFWPKSYRTREESTRSGKNGHKWGSTWVGHLSMHNRWPWYSA